MHRSISCRPVSIKLARRCSFSCACQMSPNRLGVVVRYSFIYMRATCIKTCLSDTYSAYFLITRLVLITACSDDNLGTLRLEPVPSFVPGHAAGNVG
jgi:hypothetical protein